MAKYDAYGTTLYRGTSGAGTAIAQIRNISGPGLSLDTEDVTAHDSTGAWEEVVATILRSGELSLEIVYDPANATHKNAAGGLLADMVARAAQTYTLVFPDAASTEWVFSAFVTGFEPGMPHEGALTASVSMKPTGSPTLA
jgi:predicted secreted protein